MGASISADFKLPPKTTCRWLCMYKIKLDQAPTKMLRVLIPRGWGGPLSMGDGCFLYDTHMVMHAMVPTWLPGSGCAELILSLYIYIDTKAWTQASDLCADYLPLKPSLWPHHLTLLFLVVLKSKPWPQAGDVVLRQRTCLTSVMPHSMQHCKPLPS